MKISILVWGLLCAVAFPCYAQNWTPQDSLRLNRLLKGEGEVKLNPEVLQELEPVRENASVPCGNASEPVVEEVIVETKVSADTETEEVKPSSVLGESIKTSVGFRHSISLNDSFRFSRELFGGDVELMNRVVEQLSAMSSYKTAVAFLSSKVNFNEENETLSDFLELLKKYFNQSA